MTKSQVVREIAHKTGIEKTIIESILEAYMNSVKDHVSEKEMISFRGFGNFTVKKRAAKIARNISKNTTIHLAAHYIPYFKPSKKFSERVKKIK
jgi:DNA-binding protein HU-beta